MNNSVKPTIAIIGAGKVGLALAKLFSDSGFRVQLGVRKIGTLSPLVKNLANSSNNITISDNASAVDSTGICILAVEDKSIQKVCDSLLDDFERNSIIAHCSGALDSSILEKAANSGHTVCSLHPLNTFPTIQAALDLFSNQQHNTSLYCEGNAAALTVCLPLFEQIGFRTIEISRRAKPLYHAACVFACNYLVSLTEISLKTADAAGLDPDEFWDSLQPLIQATLSNISNDGTAKALSGPIARGDAQTLHKHLSALGENNTTLQTSYRDLGQYALSLAKDRGELSKERIAELEQLLQ